MHGQLNEILIFAGKKVSVDSGSGRILIRKECLRFIVSLGSSVGVKSAEQGLLM